MICAYLDLIMHLSKEISVIPMVDLARRKLDPSSKFEPMTVGLGKINDNQATFQATPQIEFHA